MDTYRFGPFELDPQRFELRRDGAVVELQRQVFDALAYLVRHRDRVVSKEELLRGAWRDAVVSDGAISQVISLARKALGDDGGDQRFIKTLRGRGFRFVGDLGEPPATATLRPADAAPLRARPFVGRAAELAALTQAFERASKGRGGLVLISGEPGIGKTRLLQETVAPWGRAFWGRCHESEGAAAFSPWVQALRPLLDHSNVETVEQLFPELAPARGFAPSRTVAPGSRFELFAAVARQLDALSKKRTLTLVFEDLHAADEPTLRLLEYLQPLLKTMSVLVLASCRDTEPTSPGLRRRFADALQLSVTGLDAEHVGELLAHQLDEAVRAASAKTAREATLGNPFLVEELARALSHEGGIGALPRVSAAFQMSDRALQAVRRGLATLPAQTLTLLKGAAVLGRELELSVLCDVAQLKPAVALEQLGPAVSARWVTEAGFGRFRFAHALVREALYTELLPAERAQLHQRCVEALEAQYPAPSAAIIAELAHHAHLAAFSAGAEKAVRYLTLAAAEARGRLAFEEAVALLERALQAATLAPAREETRAALLVDLGEALGYAGAGPAALEKLEQAQALARKLGDAALLVRAIDVHVSVEKNILDLSLVPLVEEALTAAPPGDSTVRVRLLSRLALCHTFMPDPEPPERLGREAVEMARRLKDAGTLSVALHARRWSRRGLVPAPELLALSKAALTEALNASDRALAAHARSFVITDCIALALKSELEEQLELQRLDAEALRSPALEMIVTRFRAVHALLLGDIEAGERLAAQARELGERMGDANALITWSSKLALIRREQGRLREMEPVAEAFIELAPWNSAWKAWLCFMRCELGDLAAARPLFEELARDGFAGSAAEAAPLVQLVYLADAAASLGDVPRAEALLRLLTPHAAELVVVFAGAVCQGPVARALARLATLCGRAGDAERWWDLALERCDAMGARGWRARVEAQRAQ